MSFSPFKVGFCPIFLLILLFLLIFECLSEQQPLKLNISEIREVIAEVCSESSSPITNQLSTPKIVGNNGQHSSDVAASVLIKLVIDM